MQLVISAIKRQIKLEEGKAKEREIMLANKDVMVFEKPLPNVDQNYVLELKQVLPLLEYLANPIEVWNKVVDGVIHVPDELDPLINKIAFQLRFHTICGKGQEETICSMVAIAQKFFHEYRPVAKDIKAGNATT
jgi:hypothetical protein